MKLFTKVLVLSGILLASTAFTSTAPQDIDKNDVKGVWWNAEKTAKIRIYKAKNQKYYGKIHWLREPNNAQGKPKKDPENPNPKLRDRDRLGMLIMKSFTWDPEEKLWEDGTIYDPNNGKTYDGYIRMEAGNKDKLYLRGYVMGMTWLGRTSEWERAE